MGLPADKTTPGMNFGQHAAPTPSLETPKQSPLLTSFTFDPVPKTGY